MNPHIMIIGAGRIGAAIAFLLKKYAPAVWDSDETRLSSPVDCDREMQIADIIFLCVPTSAHASVCKKIRRCSAAHTVVVSLAKGLGVQGELVPDIMRKYLSVSQVGILCGPMMAEEIVCGKKSFAVFATASSRVLSATDVLFVHSSLCLQQSQDVRGVAWLSVLKNVYAIVYGAAVGLALGSNTEGYLLSRIAQEAQHFLKLMKFSPSLFLSPAGIGDLYCTITSHHSRNRSYGVALAQGGSAVIKGEGAYAIRIIKKKLGRNFASFPVLVLAYKLVCGKSPRAIFSEFTKRV